jgi:hypothetical protein
MDIGTKNTGPKRLTELFKSARNKTEYNADLNPNIFLARMNTDKNKKIMNNDGKNLNITK